ncbi:MAG: hypothetical protein C4557_10240 [Anaerolineaceae bacterium]|jgi:membrane protein YdbS with pleckstrin-like domain|nr:MAG: hypothetical protein C4557_10240 [Anaerolineaceae bacterium]
MAAKPKLDKDEILQAEYKYIAETVFQANEDRSRFTSFYFVTVGSFAAAIVGTRFEPQQQILSIAFFILFTVLTVMGALTISQLARLRAAWHESVEAMNHIKDYYIKHNPEIEPAFKWRRHTIPPTDKPRSIANLIAIEVAMLSSLTAATAVYFLLTFFNGASLPTWILSGAGFIISFAAQWKWYKRLLVDDR